MTSGKRVLDLEEHFRSRLIIQPSGHWRYGTRVNNKGYACVCHAGDREYAHRVSHHLFIGPIPPGYDVDHLCGLTWCVNPMHLEAITHSENIRRAYRECGAKLHDMTNPANYYVRSNGGRMCRPCNERRNRARLSKGKDGNGRQ
ncbi:HNH endonuclease signature motif containing protein [Streptomyces atriruber]|uniref:HNH endonuclease signature motif containing protein n=1 Tax=Streptomyces atriruber TaxID=545121 RepID=UPI000B0B452C